ncbi:CBS domain-containing protein [Piscirickettsia litoralis]|uniref:CBS domain-containing protein n=1 Tax=Piscirickettsia litoralis TaxID=1891921 RepID=UPI0013019AD0|nr:CBS domain-containing protein [Piscirickettsia litoralis]
MKEKKFSHLVVMDAGNIAGVISDRDILNALGATDSKEKCASEIMTSDPICVSEKTSIYKSIQLMLEHNISCLPVTNKENNLSGLVSLKNLLQQFMKELKGLESEGSIDFRFLK